MTNSKPKSKLSDGASCPIGRVNVRNEHPTLYRTQLSEHNVMPHSLTEYLPRIDIGASCTIHSPRGLIATLIEFLRSAMFLGR